MKIAHATNNSNLSGIGAKNPHCDQQLSDMSLGVFGCVYEKPKHRGRKLRTAYGAVFGERESICLLQLVERSIHLGVKIFDQFSEAGFARSLRSQIFGLNIIQRFTPSIGQQPIENTGKVLQMKTRRRHSGWPFPQSFFRKTPHQRVHFFARLKQCMCNRL
jgi:hypothetical protein